jgi:hypothetical protein
MANSVLANQSLTWNSAGSTQGARIQSVADDVVSFQGLVGGSSITFTRDSGTDAWLIGNLKVPVSGTDGANKNYVDSVAQGLDVHSSVRVATTANVASPSSTLVAGFTVDGVVLVAGDRVLVKDQTAPHENGIYVVDAVTTVRAADMTAGDTAA